MLFNHGPFRRAGVESYVSRMSKPKETPIYDSTVTTILEKAGYSVPNDPASIYDPEQLWKQLERYSENDSFHEDDNVREAIKVAFRVFGKREHCNFLEPLKSETEIIKAIKLEKHAGVYFSDKASAWPRAWTRSLDILENEKKPNPCLAGVRTQRDNKTRLVWMFPLDMTILEARVAQPLIEQFKIMRSPMPYAKRKFELGARLEYTLTERNKVALDFSKFDSSISPKLIKVAFRILKTWFAETVEMDKLWEVIIKYFIETPIVMIDGNLYSGKRKGVPSGSFFTQLIDSVVNFIIIYASMLKHNLHPNSNKIHILGDDSVFSTNENVSLRDLKNYFLTLGFTLNVIKSEVKRKNESIHFLGFDWVKGVSYRDLDKILSSMSQPETWRKREKLKHLEMARAFRLIVEMTTLGGNLYEVAQRVTKLNPRDLNYYKPEGYSHGGYSSYQKEYNPSKVDHNISTGMWV